MANEIVALTREGGEQGALFLFTLTPVVINGVTMVATPSAGLPPVAAAALTTQEKADLDAGTKAFEVHSFTWGGAGGLLARVQDIYAKQAARFAADYAMRYDIAGNRYNA